VVEIFTTVGNTGSSIGARLGSDSPSTLAGNPDRAIDDEQVIRKKRKKYLEKQMRVIIA
jgi:hypothetical protein